jgi:phage terminase large subunit
LEKFYPKNVRVVERPSKKAVAINAVRSILPLCNFDETKTSEGWQCLSRYAYKVDEDTGVFSKEPEHDTPWSHGADAMTTMALSFKTEADAKKPKPLPSQQKTRVLNLHPNSNGWMG